MCLTHEGPQTRTKEHNLISNDEDFFTESDTTDSTESSITSYISEILYSDTESNAISIHLCSTSLMSQDFSDYAELSKLDSAPQITEHPSPPPTSVLDGPW